MSFDPLTTGIESKDLGGNINVYPNPTQGKFTYNIDLPEASDLIIELVNSSGQVLYRNEVSGAYSFSEEVDARFYANGIYYLKVNDGKQVRIKKVVVF